MISILEILVNTFVTLIGVGAIVVLVLYIIDRTQTAHAIRRNYPVVGRFRYLFEHLGEFFRQYFFAMDREEMPFNRAERNWVYRASKKEVENTLAFGSTRDLRPVGTVIFVNTPYPTLDEEAIEITPLSIGPYVPNPHTARYAFNISGMSYGAISRPAVLALSRGARKANIWMNTGEGGLSPHHLEGGCDIVFQIGTAKYGIRGEDGSMSEEKLADLAKIEQVKMFELKLSQGAKPGKGGILPGAKVTEEIAGIRGIPVGQDSISPNRHLEVKSADDLIDFINRIRDITEKPTGFKSVVGNFESIEEICMAIERRGIESAPDFMTIDSADGGTGAAPMSLMDYMGIPLRESLPRVMDILRKYGLNKRIRVVASGKLTNPSQLAWALCAGADYVATARGFMFALGCIQAMQCNKNTCPTGITTHDKKLQRGLDVTDKAERVYQYAIGIRKEVGVIAHSCGVREPRELRRRHCRIVQSDGQSIALNELFPEPDDI